MFIIPGAVAFTACILVPNWRRKGEKKNQQQTNKRTRKQENTSTSTTASCPQAPSETLWHPCSTTLAYISEQGSEVGELCGASSSASVSHSTPWARLEYWRNYQMHSHNQLPFKQLLLNPAAECNHLYQLDKKVSKTQWKLEKLKGKLPRTVWLVKKCFHLKFTFLSEKF